MERDACRYGYRLAWLIAALATDSCYLSDEYRNGIAVEVLVEAPRSYSLLGELRPARGARVIGQRCSDGATAEARVGSDGIAWINLPHAPCLTITAMRPDGDSAISLVRVKTPIEAPIVFRTKTLFGVEDGLAVNLAGTITGRSSPGTTVSLEAPPLLFNSTDGRTSVLRTNFDTFRAREASSTPSAETRLIAIEWDELGRPINAVEATVQIDRDHATTVEVAFPSPAIAMETRTDTIEIPKTGALSFDDLQVVGAYVFRTTSEGFRFITGSSHSVPIAESTISKRYELTTREPALGWTPDFLPNRAAVLSHEGSVSIFDIAGGMALSEEPGAILVPPVESAEFEVASFDSPRIRIGGPGHIGYVAISNNHSSFGIRWEIFGDRDAILTLDEWPILPTGIEWRDLDSETADRLTVFAGVTSSEDQTMWGGVFFYVPLSGWDIFVDSESVDVGP